MRSELSEADAKGSIAAIYAEVRELCAVPYVSSLHRHLASRPGWLEWAWAAIGPAFRSGLAQEAAWQVATDLRLRPLAAIPRESLRIWGVTADEECIVAAVCESFVRVSPTNMIFSGLLKALLAGPAGASGRPLPAWTPPAPLPPLPEMVADDDAAPPVRAILQALRSGEGTEAFVPGLYRMLAHWPGLLAHLATVLSPRFSDPDTLAAGDTLRERIDAAVPGVLAHLPGPAHGGPPVPRRSEHAEVLSALEAYRVTSPQMVVFGRLIREALPG